MKVLLDTHAFLWWIGDDSRLSPGAHEVISDGDNEVFFSVASAWEIAIKAGAGRLQLFEDAKALVTGGITDNSLSVLPVHLAHALRVHDLPNHHRDPFDRLLAAQSLIEELPIISRDPCFGPYGVDVVW